MSNSPQKSAILEEDDDYTQSKLDVSNSPIDFAQQQQQQSSPKNFSTNLFKRTNIIISSQDSKVIHCSPKIKPFAGISQKVSSSNSNNKYQEQQQVRQQLLEKNRRNFNMQNLNRLTEHRSRNSTSNQDDLRIPSQKIDQFWAKPLQKLESSLRKSYQISPNQKFNQIRAASSKSSANLKIRYQMLKMKRQQEIKTERLQTEGNQIKKNCVINPFESIERLHPVNCSQQSSIKHYYPTPSDSFHPFLQSFQKYQNTSPKVYLQHQNQSQQQQQQQQYQQPKNYFKKSKKSAPMIMTERCQRKAVGNKNNIQISQFNQSSTFGNDLRRTLNKITVGNIDASNLRDEPSYLTKRSMQQIEGLITQCQYEVEQKDLERAYSCLKTELSNIGDQAKLLPKATKVSAKHERLIKAFLNKHHNIEI